MREPVCGRAGEAERALVRELVLRPKRRLTAACVCRVRVRLRDDEREVRGIEPVRGELVRADPVREVPVAEAADSRSACERVSVRADSVLRTVRALVRVERTGLDTRGLRPTRGIVPDCV